MLGNGIEQALRTIESSAEIGAVGGKGDFAGWIASRSWQHYLAGMVLA